MMNKRVGRKIGKKRSRNSLLVESLEGRQMMAADVVSVLPANNGTGAPGDNLVVTFSEDVQPGVGTGQILIKKSSDGSLIEAVNVHSNRVTFAGAKVTIDPVNDLPGQTKVYVEVGAGAVRDKGTAASVKSIFAENFDALPLKNSSFDNPFDRFVVTITGVLDVKTAGEYTFGVNSDDGQALWIDVNKNGLDVTGFNDEIIIDDTTHGRQDRLSTCVDGAGLFTASCAGTGTGSGTTLAVGQYPFQFLFFDSGGGAGGEVFYAPGYQEAFDGAKFSLFGDDSKGIGVTADGLTVTAYKAADNTIAIGNLAAAADLRDGVIARHSLFPATAKVALADVHDIGGNGRYSINNPIPKKAEWIAANDPNSANFNDQGPFGWNLDDSYLYATHGQGAVPAEYEGWSFMNKDLWIAEQGGQERQNYTLGQNVVALVDPDAYDDFKNIDVDGGDTKCAALDENARKAGPDCGLFQAGMSTPKIYLSGVAANTAVLKFDSSWRDEPTQAARGRVQYFAADGSSLGTKELFRWESDANSPNYKKQKPEEGVDTANETLTYNLENPANADSFVVTFEMPYAQNDWWWAVDNIDVSANVTGALSAAVTGNTAWTFTTTTGGGTTLAGDIDKNGKVEFADFLILSGNFDTTVPANTLGDIDGNGKVEFSDFLILSENFGKSIPAAPAAAPAAISIDVMFALSDSDDDDDSTLIWEL